MENDLPPKPGQHSCPKEGNDISFPYAQTWSIKTQKGHVRRGLLEPGSVPAPHPHQQHSATYRTQPRAEWGRNGEDVKHEGQTNLGVFIFSKKLLSFS